MDVDKFLLHAKLAFPPSLVVVHRLRWERAALHGM